MRSNFFLAAALAAAFFTTQARADIHRGCSGSVQSSAVAWINKAGEHIKRGNQEAAPSELIVDLEGRGFCKRRTQSEQCRHDARDAIKACANWIWDHRWNTTLGERIAGCVTEFRGGPRRQGKIEDWARASEPDVNLYGDIKRTIEYNSCCVQRAHAREVWSRVFLSIGTTNTSSFATVLDCSHSEDFSGDYHSDCTKLRAEGLCGAGRIPKRVNP
ncbi:hypothetical protein [Hyphococcus luteus]|uniref:Uncharacterized protein n=1 Tax=Hyphococcus luteus TaxID=2058213 RepID=A0A2S7K3N4_9PROT|nr:hypothetical protein [Marinicaulis flavus]PQA87112.1 hypothetical protein CW354_13790 [Marinicaulis flavus]